MSPSQFRKFLFLKLPSAFWSGIKLKSLTHESCETIVKLSWFNQNPFRSMFWAVQGMAAELSTGTLCIEAIQNSNEKVSMLVIAQEAQFFKKAVGKIQFTCHDGKAISDTIQEAIESGEGKTLLVTSIGVDASGDMVSKFVFTWSFKKKAQKKAS